MKTRYSLIKIEKLEKQMQVDFLSSSFSFFLSHLEICSIINYIVCREITENLYNVCR